MSKLTKALKQIEQNGDLLFYPAPTPEVERIYRELQQRELIERNQWSDRWLLSEAGRAALKEKEQGE